MFKRWLILIPICYGVTACDSTVYQSYEQPDNPNARVAEATKIYFYPSQDQTAEQQDRDRYECYLWAVKQSGFDPSVAQLAPHQQVEVIAESAPGTSAAAGAVTGAIAGSILAHPSHREEGAVFGAIAGAILGAAADADRQAQADAISSRANARQDARIELLARDYRRAMTACLEGRGYVVH